MKFISCGTFEKAYIYFFIIYSIFVILLLIIWEICYNKIEFQKNIVFYMFFNNIGQILCFIPEKIVDNYFLSKKNHQIY